MIIQNKIINIDGIMGSGKTLMGCFISYGYLEKNNRVYSNVDFKFEKINKQSILLKTFEEIFTKIPKTLDKKLLFLDEAGINFNSKNFRSQGNVGLTNLGVLSRKSNLDVVILSQDTAMIDVNIRQRLSNTTISMTSYIKNNEIFFYFTLKKNFNGKYKIIGVKKVDLIGFVKQTKLIYNTTEDSIIDKKNNIIDKDTLDRL